MLLFLFVVNFHVCVVLFFFYNRSTLNFFFVLMHCEARERFSLPMRSGMCAVDGIAIGWFLYGREKKNFTHI